MSRNVYYVSTGCSIRTIDGLKKSIMGCRSQIFQRDRDATNQGLLCKIHWLSCHINVRIKPIAKSHDTVDSQQHGSFHPVRTTIHNQIFCKYHADEEYNSLEKLEIYILEKVVGYGGILRVMGTSKNHPRVTSKGVKNKATCIHEPSVMVTTRSIFFLYPNLMHLTAPAISINHMKWRNTCVSDHRNEN